MALNFQYYYAEIILSTGLCRAVMDTTDYYDPAIYPEYIPIPEYNEGYLMKYYNQADGKWYLESTFETEWSPA